MAVASNPLETFLWGSGGSMRTPEQVAREREIAAAMMGQSMNYSPVEHWLQGAARASQGLVGGLKSRWADEAEQRGRSGFQSEWDNVFGGGQAASAGPIPSDLPGGVGAPAAIPAGENAAYIRDGLISRGMPEHIADAFLLNMQDESGLNAGINELTPTVPGSRGGFGLYQLTGPRRTAYEAYAQGQGLPLDSVDAQLDFLMSELSGPEAAANKAIMAAPDTGTAAAAIVNQFLRPAEEHRARREAAYLGGAAPRTQVASAGGGSPSMAQLLGLASNEWASPAQQSIVQSLLGQQMQQQDPRYQQQLALGDLQRQQAEIELERLRTPAAPAPVFEGGQWWDVAGGMPTPITDRPNDPTSGMQNYDFLISQGVSPDEAAARSFSGGVTVNNLPQVGTPPPGYQNVLDDQGRLIRQDVIEGGPVWLEQQAARAAQEAGGEATGRTANIVREDIDRIRDIVTNAPWFNPAVGFGSDLAQSVAGSNATNVAALSKTVLANIGFDRLQQMRDASPTGGALGSISDRELGTLQSVMGNLEQSQSVDQFLYNLDRLGTVYDEILRKAAAYPNSSNFGFERKMQEPSQSNATSSGVTWSFVD